MEDIEYLVNKAKEAKTLGELRHRLTQIKLLAEAGIISIDYNNLPHHYSIEKMK